MEFFLLAVISRGGLSSLYELQRHAGLEPGGIRPALARLEADGCISRGDHETRNKRKLAVTPKGVHFLEKNWLFSLQSYADIESVLRATAVALFMQEPNVARTYLQTTSFQRSQSAKQKEAEAGPMPANDEALSFYRWLRKFCDARRNQEEASALLEICKAVKDRTSPNDGVR